MNIAIITTWFSAGAGYVSKAYQQILEKEHNVFIYARGGQVMKGHPEWDGHNITWAPRHYNGIKTSHFIKWAKRKKIDVIFFNEQRYWRPVLEAKKAGFCIGSYIDYYTQDTVPAFKIYDFLICNTERHYSVFEWHNNVHYIPWGTNTETYKPNQKISNSTPTFMISAGWQPKMNKDRRGSLLAIDAFKNVKGNCKLIVYSQVSKVDFAPIWRNSIEDDKRIELKVGTFDPFPFSEGDVYLYPSRLDGIGLTLPEAISSGLAAITTDNGPMNEFVKQDYNGLLVDVEKYLGRSDGYYWAESICNINSLTNAMQIYVDNTILLQEHKKNARILALENLNWKKNAISLCEIFEHEKLKDHDKITPEITRLLKYLDTTMAPSDNDKLQSAFYSICRSFTNKLSPKLTNYIKKTIAHSKF